MNRKFDLSADACLGNLANFDVLPFQMLAPYFERLRNCHILPKGFQSEVTHLVRKILMFQYTSFDRHVQTNAMENHQGVQHDRLAKIVQQPHRRLWA